MTNFFPKNVEEAASKLSSDWLKGSDFDGAGLVLKVSKPMETVKSQYGAEEGDYLVENNLLSAGESFRYTFEDTEGKERKIDSSSTPFFIGFKQCEELGVGDWVRIVRTGKTDKTRYTVEKVDAPEITEKVSPAKKDYPQPKDNINPEDVPF
jgi:hypothetical protein